MAIILNDNIKVNAGKPSESKYLNSSNTAYSGATISAAKTAVTTAIPISERYLGLTVLVTTGSTNTEYWFKTSVQDSGLIEKKFTSEQLVGDFITGATNMGYFSGTTGIQTLDLSGFPYDGNYYSQYNWYYLDGSGGNGIVRIGSPTHDGPLRRAYVDAGGNYSWIYSVLAGNWVLALGDVTEKVGFDPGAIYSYAGTGYTQTEWATGWQTNGSTSITASGSLTTGDTLIIGAPIYSHKADQDLYLRTPISDTPEFLQVSTDDNYIRFSGVSSVITATNYGSGTGVYSGKTGGDLKFRTLVPSGDTTITTKSDGRLIIYSSSDGSANAITGVTNTTGGTGIYSGTTDRNIQLYSLVGSGDTSVSLVDDKIVINSEGGGVNGSVFISDITPQSSGNVGSKTFSSDGEVLDDCTTDTQLVTVSVFALPGNTNYNPVVRINGVQVPLTPESDAPLFSGTLNVNLSGATEITVIHEDGAEHTVYITQEVPPVVLAANFTGGYPGTQSELKENDTFDFYVESDVPVVAVELDNFEAYQSGVYSVSSGTGHTVTGDIADRGDVAQNQRGRVRVQKSTGSWSSWFTTSGSVDGTGYVVLNNLYPTITFGTIVYPATQSALKDSETATVNHTVVDYNTITYSSPNSELNITGTTTYDAAKIAQRIAGGYNITTDNFRIVANRTANDATTTDNEVVWIAHDSQVITVTPEYTRLRSGGNDNTTAPDYEIRISSTQRLSSAPTLVAPIGIWQGAGFSWSAAATSFTRDIQINDNMTKGTYSWGALATTNLAGKSVTTITTGTDYTLGGFVSRDISLAAFAYTANMNVEAITSAKVTLSWTYEPTVVNQQPVGTDIPPPVTNGWALSALGSNPTIIRILDSKTSASSQASTITIQEAI